LHAQKIKNWLQGTQTGIIFFTTERSADMFLKPQVHASCNAWLEFCVKESCTTNMFHSSRDVEFQVLQYILKFRCLVLLFIKCNAKRVNAMKVRYLKG